LLRQIENLTDVLLKIGLGVLDPRDAANHVGSQFHRLPHQRRRTRLAHQTILRKSHYLNVYHSFEFVPRPDQRLDALEPRLAVHVGQRADVRVAIDGRQRHCPAYILNDPRLVVLFFDTGGEFNSRHRPAHTCSVVAAQGLLVHHLACIHFAEVKVRVGERLRHQLALRV